jgi:hypothetical protein
MQAFSVYLTARGSGDRQVQLAGAGGAVWLAGDGVGVGLVGCVQDERRVGREHGGGDERWRACWVSDGERVIRWTDVIERGRGERGEHGGRERERERGGLRDEQVLDIF